MTKDKLLLWQLWQSCRIRVKNRGDNTIEDKSAANKSRNATSPPISSSRRLKSTVDGIVLQFSKITRHLLPPKLAGDGEA